MMKKNFYLFLLLSSIIGLQAQNSETDYNVHQTPYHPYDIPAPLPLVYIDDDFSSVLDIGFPFTFFANTYEQLLIGDNGVISFNIDLAGQYCSWQINHSIPFTGLIDLKTNMCPADIQLFAPDGKLMRESKPGKIHNEITFPAANGVYFLKITTKLR